MITTTFFFLMCLILQCGKIKYIISTNFTYQPTQLAFTNISANISTVKILSGEFFNFIIQLQLYDNTSALVSSDSTSKVKISLYYNPENAVLGPPSSLFVKALRGKVTFSTLRISKPGNHYRFGFTLYKLVDYTWNKSYENTGIVLLSNVFKVYNGYQRQLKTIVNGNNAWASGQAMLTQPIVAVTDYDGNTVTTDYNSISTVSMISSPGTYNKIRINTTDLVNSIIDFDINVDSGTYGIGKILKFYVIFKYEVWSTSDSNITLLTNIYNTISNSYARAEIVTPITKIKIITFEYITQFGDICDDVDYMNNHSLVIGPNNNLYDGNNNTVITTLPSQSLSKSKSIKITTYSPVVTALSCNTSSGEYGVGQVIEFAITFNSSVIVYGYPYLVLNVLFYDYESYNIIANYSKTSNDSLVLYFIYTVSYGHSSSLLSINSNYSYIETNNTASIKQSSDFPSVIANLTVTTDIVSQYLSVYQIVIDTTQIRLSSGYGLRANLKSGTYLPGEVIYLTVQATKPIISQGVSISLKLNAGSSNSPYAVYAVIDSIESDSMTVIFKLTVPNNPLVNTTQLDLFNDEDCLIFPPDGLTYIRRLATHPTMDIDSSTSLIFHNARSLTRYRDIALSSINPFVQSIDVVRTSYKHNGTLHPSHNITLHPDEYIIISIEFSQPIVITCNPVLIVYAKYYEEAIYSSGNETSTLFFNYTVKIGDESKHLYLRYFPYSLCPVSGCPRHSLTKCKIYGMSTFPTLEVNYDIPKYTGSSLDNGILINSSIIIKPNQLNRNTTITSVSCSLTSGSYGGGTTIYYYVNFTDIVVVSAPTYVYPTLYLNNGQFAQYFGGSNTQSLSFIYIVTSTDTINELKPYNYSLTSHTCIYCLSADNCSIKNRNNQHVQLNTNHTIFHNNVIKLDNTPPYIINTYTNASNLNTYTIGDSIYLFIEFNKVVVVFGVAPILVFYINSIQRYAYLSLSSNDNLNYYAYTSDILCFVYEVLEDDITESLSLANSYLYLNDNHTTIYLSSDSPEIIANTTIPYQKHLKAINGSYINIPINTYNKPQVTNIVIYADSKEIYRVGDVIYIEIELSHTIISTGFPYLHLNCGKNIGIANYIGYNMSSLFSSNNSYNISLPIPPTKFLYLKYIVNEDDFNPKLDYIDRYSLFPGLDYYNHSGNFLYASRYSSIYKDYISSQSIIENSIVHSLYMIDLPLPQPGEIGSISYSYSLYIDGYKPYLTGISFMNYSSTDITNQPIYLLLNFSSNIITTGNNIQIKLNTNRFAYLIASNNTKNYLIFRYDPQPGDHTTNLDYYYSKYEYNNAIDSIIYNNNKILSYSENPSQIVEIHLNPINGKLIGNIQANVSNGLFYFNDLSITQLGLNYHIDFYCYSIVSNKFLRLYQSIFVSYSNEYELRPNQSIYGSKGVGESVALHDDIVVLGAPQTNKTILSVQSITTSGAFLESQAEIQSIQLSSDLQPLILSFYTTADVGATIGGYFTITYGTHGTSRGIPADATQDTINGILNYDLPSLGSISVTRVSYIYCACNNAYNWTFTFNDITEGTYDSFILNGDQLTGVGVEILGPFIIQTPALISGSFTLKITGTSQESDPIAYDADVYNMTEGLLSIGLSVMNIAISSSSLSRTRSWLITFDEYNSSYQVPLLLPVKSNLSGGNVTILTDILRPGIYSPSGITGYFIISFRGYNTSNLLSNITAEEMKAKLEELPVITSVNVTRVLPTYIGGYTWIISFIEVKKYTPYGFITDPYDDVDSLVLYNYLIGTNATVTLGSPNVYNKYASMSTQGTYGSNAGSVYIFQNVDNSWIEVAEIIANDTQPNDNFGYSVAITGSNIILPKTTLVIGAYSAEKIVLPIIQQLHCHATSGSFTLSIHGWTTPYISTSTTYDIFLSTLGEYLNGIYGISVIDWGNTGICDNNNITISYNNVNGGNIYLTIDNYNLTLYSNEAIIQLTLLQSPVYVPSPEPQGAVYFYENINYCGQNTSVCIKSNWKLSNKFYPLTSYGYEKFGYSVAIDSVVALVGSPGSRNQVGSVYVYQYSSISLISTEYEWIYLQELIVPGLSSGSGFGSTVAISGNTIIVGAPYTDSNTGSAYVFFRASVTAGQFTEVQVILPVSTSLSYSLSSGDLYGYSVSISGNTVVIGSPGRTDEVIYTGTYQLTNQSNCGSVFIYTRQSELYEFVLLQKLLPTNVKTNDNFGWTVSISDSLVIVGAVETYIGSLYTSRTVISIVTQADYDGTPLSGTFTLQWLSTYSLVYRTWILSLSTRDIPYDTTAADMQSILMEDLNTGNIIVTRSNVDSNDNGYQWLVTFIDLLGEVSLFQANYNNLQGTNAYVNISYYVPSSIDLRGLSHVFSLSNNYYIEELMLSPYSYQSADRCGYAVAVYNNYAVVGCPNRDIYISGDNSGVGLIYNLNIINLSLKNSSDEVIEGLEYSIIIHQKEEVINHNDIYFSIHSLDRNAEISTQLRILQLYGLTYGELVYPLTPYDMSGICGTAIGTSQYYGSQHNASIWVDGMIDYRGINDYLPIDKSLVYINNDNNLTIQLNTISDLIYELPYENITIGLYSPGIWPSPLGHLFHTVTLNDNKTGLYDYESESSNNTINHFNQLQYTKLYSSKYNTDDELGSIVRLLDNIGVMFVGIPNANDSTGYVIHYKRNNKTNEWIEKNIIYSPISNSTNNLFGEEIGLTEHTSSNVSICVISEPILCKVHVYISNDKGNTYIFDTSLSVDMAYLPQHGFGILGTIGIDGNLLAVGAPGIEAIFVFIRKFDSTIKSWYWTSGQLYRSSDFDYDIIYTVTVLHTQGFGTSVSVSDRTIAVGSPYADYDKLGTDLVEVDWNTQGDSILSYGRGKAYLFYSSPSIQRISLYSDEILGQGNFKLIFNNSGINDTTTYISYRSEPLELKGILQDLMNIDSVDVSYDYIIESNYCLHYWTITFLSEWETPTLLQPIWYDNGCPDCQPFNYTFSHANHKQIIVESISSIGEIEQQSIIKAYDGKNGDRFGQCIELNHDELMIGAPYSSSITLTTWDFETGLLTGWSKTGDAFNYQPTYGDNSYYRENYNQNSLNDYRSNAKSSGLKGLYYIGTYEKHPGSIDNYLLPNSLYNWGNIQGDKPQGTLTSDVFIIYGTTISFLIGGGCNKLLEYIELVVDGFSVASETGNCNERMYPSSFNVTDYYQRAAYIRIVDQSSSIWGHINIDQIEFDWDVTGPTYNNSNGKISNIGKVETPNSGAVYIYTRRINNTDQPCQSNKSECSWINEAKLIPSNKRSFLYFGSSISLDSKTGIAIIGSPGSSLIGIYGEIPSIYPFYNSSGYNDIAGINYPITKTNMDVFNALPANKAINSGAHGVWYSGNITNYLPNTMTTIQSGSVYIYVKTKYIESENGTILQQQHWSNIETARIQAPDGYAYDNFGSSISLSNYNIVIGSPGNDGIAENAGAIYTYHLGFTSLSFQKVQFEVYEGVNAYAIVTILRDSSIYNGDLAITYATSDLSAKGIDSYKYNNCMYLPVSERGQHNCGDYELTSGTLSLLSGIDSTGFTVRIMNDLCKEAYSKYIQVTLSIPGSGLISGYKLYSLIRIDDDDYNGLTC